MLEATDTAASWISALRKVFSGEVEGQVTRHPSWSTISQSGQLHPLHCQATKDHGSQVSIAYWQGLGPRAGRLPVQKAWQTGLFPHLRHWQRRGRFHCVPLVGNSRRLDYWHYTSAHQSYSICGIAVQFREGITAMGIGKSLVGWTALHLARFLATRPATPLILTGTMALAAFGATATNPTTIQQSPTAVVVTTQAPTYPNASCYADPDGDGSTVCHIPASLVSSYPNAYCHADWDGDGTFVCHFIGN